MEPVKPQPKIVSPKTLHPLRRLSHLDSDSDENELQIDEDGDIHQTSKNTETVLITESQIEVEQRVGRATEGAGEEVELWDEIYGNIVVDDQKNSSTDSPSSVSGLHPLKKSDGLQKEETDKTEHFKIFEDRKSIEQLERERELLLSLVKERDRMNEIVASVPTPEEIILDNEELEEGELSDSGGEEEVEIVTSPSDNKETGTPSVDPEVSTSQNREKEPIQIPLRRFSVEKLEVTAVRNTVNIDLEDFTSPASPTGIQLDLDNDEIDVIPLERDKEDEEPEVLEVPPDEKYKHYWEEFSQEERKEKEGPRGEKIFEMAREKLSNFIRSSPSSTKSPGPPAGLFMKAAQGLRTLASQTPGPRPLDPPINFVMQDEVTPNIRPNSKPNKGPGGPGGAGGPGGPGVPGGAGGPGVPGGPRGLLHTRGITPLRPPPFISSKARVEYFAMKHK